MEKLGDVNLLRQLSLREYRENLDVSSEKMEKRMSAILKIQARQFGDERTVKKK